LQSQSRLPQALRLHGSLDWLCNRPAAAQRCWAESLALAERFAFPIERAQTLMEMGQRTGDAAIIEQAAEVFRQTGATTYLTLALRALEHVQTHDTPQLARKEPLHLQLPPERNEEAA
jgi:hypothetical protein